MAKSRNPKGLGHYYKKNNLFCWKYVRDGKPLYRSSKTEKGLQVKVRKVIGLTVSNDKTKVSDYFENWLENIVKPLKKEATYEQYYYMYNGHIKPSIGNFKMVSITSTDIQKVIADMNKKVYEKKDKDGKVISTKIGTSTKTMKHCKTAMSIVFKRAFEDDKIIPTNPVRNIVIPVKQAKPMKTLKTDELATFLKSIEKSRWIWSVKFALVTGLRRGELLALKWTDVDWDNNRITIDKSNSVTGLGDTKSSKIHYVPLSEMGKTYLFNQMDMLKTEKNKITINDNNTIREDLKGMDLLIFPAKNGEMVKPNTYYHTIVRYAEGSGIKVHPHCFRHTFVYNMRNKLSLKELQDILGHDESTTTLDIYGDLLNDTTDSKAKTIDEVFTQIDIEIEKKRAAAADEEFKIIDFAARRKAK